MQRTKELIRDILDLLTEADRHVYHVTYAKHLAGIAQHGLRPGRGQAMGQGGNTGHSSKRVFLTSPEGVHFWHGRAEDHGNDLSDSPHKTGHTPVVLRIKKQKGDRYTKDPAGSEDASAPAHIYKKDIPPEHIEVFHGDKWHPVADHEKINTREAHDDEGYLKQDHENPLHPKPVHLGLEKQKT